MSETIAKGYLYGRFAYAGIAKDGLPPINEGVLVLRALSKYKVDRVSGTPRGILPVTTKVQICDGEFEGSEDYRLSLPVGNYELRVETKNWRSRTVPITLSDEHTKTNPLDVPSLFVDDAVSNYEAEIVPTLKNLDDGVLVKKSQAIETVALSDFATTDLTPVNDRLANLQDLIDRINLQIQGLRDLSQAASDVAQDVQVLSSRLDNLNESVDRFGPDLLNILEQYETKFNNSDEAIKSSVNERWDTFYQEYGDGLIILPKVPQALQQIQNRITELARRPEPKAPYDSGWHDITGELTLPEGTVRQGRILARRIESVCHLLFDRFALNRGSYTNAFSSSFIDAMDMIPAADVRMSVAATADNRSFLELQIDRLPNTYRITAHQGHTTIGTASWVTDKPTPSIFPGVPLQ